MAARMRAIFGEHTTAFWKHIQVSNSTWSSYESSGLAEHSHQCIYRHVNSLLLWIDSPPFRQQHDVLSIIIFLTIHQKIMIDKYRRRPNRTEQYIEFLNRVNLRIGGTTTFRYGIIECVAIVTFGFLFFLFVIVSLCVCEIETFVCVHHCQQTLESNDEMINNDFLLCPFSVINNFTLNR